MCQGREVRVGLSWRWSPSLRPSPPSFSLTAPSVGSRGNFAQLPREAKEAITEMGVEKQAPLRLGGWE